MIVEGVIELANRFSKLMSEADHLPAFEPMAGSLAGFTGDCLEVPVKAQIASAARKDR